MDKILVVEDTKFFSSILKQSLESELGISVIVAETMKSAELILSVRRDDFFLALLDLTLPDAHGDQIVQLAKNYNLPSIIFSSTLTDEIYNKMNEYDVVDYVVKDNPSALEYVLSLVNRYRNNKNINVLLVDNVDIQLKLLSHILKSYNLNVVTAQNGVEALDIVEKASKHDDTKISLVITDYEMPEMNGFDLILKLRKKWSKSKLGIIGYTGTDNKTISARFLKFGADDFIKKPFQPEEFKSRISQNLNNLEQIQKLHFSATRDYLTGMYNRRYFFHKALPLYDKYKENNTPLIVAMIDVDHFKNVNDTHGHAIGDEVLVKVAGVLSDETREEDLIARFGGEEFCLISTGLAPDVIGNYLNHIRVKLSELEFESEVSKFKITASIGATLIKYETLDEMIIQADDCLYAAKEGGRNRVIISDDD